MMLSLESPSNVREQCGRFVFLQGHLASPSLYSNEMAVVCSQKSLECQADQNSCTSVDVVIRFPALMHLQLLSLFPFASSWCRCTQTPVLPSQDSFWNLSLCYLSPYSQPFTMPGPTYIRFISHDDMLLIHAQQPCLVKRKKSVYKVPLS